MLTTTTNFKPELPFGAVCAASSPVTLRRAWAQAWAQQGKQDGFSTLGLTGEFGPISGFGAAEYGKTVNIAGPAGLAETGRTDLFRPFHTMSRRDPRAWRPPTD